MAKAPADQFYFGDYLRDTRTLSLAGKGAWMDCLCHMWFSVTRGRISMSTAGYARLFGTTVDQAKAVLDEIRELQIGDAETEHNGNITLICRRMQREDEERKANNNRQKNFRERHRGDAADENNGNITPMSHENNGLSSSSDFILQTSDLNRLIESCVREHAREDPRLVEIAVIETMIRRKGSANEHKPIKSAKYFEEEIKAMIKNGPAMGSDAIDAMLQSRRIKIGMITV